MVYSKPFKDVMIYVQQVFVPNSIQVFNIGTLSKDHLLLYFENSKSGGDEVIDAELNQDESYAIITFANKSGERKFSMCARFHQILDSVYSCFFLFFQQ